MYLTNHSEDKILRTFLGTTAIAPATMYAALFLSNPGETGAGTEIAYTGYTRMPISFSAPAVSEGKTIISNAADVVFPESDRTTNDITYMGLMDALTGGNMWGYVVLDVPVQVVAGVAPIILAQAWNYASSGNFSNAFKAKYLNLFRGVNLAGVTPYMALFNGNPDQGGAELSGAGYSRFPMEFSAPEVQPSGESMISNSESSTSPRADDSWGTLVYTAIMDSLSGGGIVAFKEYGAELNIHMGDAVSFLPGKYSVRLN